MTHPTVTSGQTSSQTIQWTYGWTDIGGGIKDGTLASVTNPAGEKVGITYSGDTIITTADPDGGGLQLVSKNVQNVFGHTTQTEDPSGATSQWDYTVTPDGRVLKVEGPNGQETKYEYNLRGFRTLEDKLLEDSPSNRVETSWAYTSGGRMDSMTADSDTGGIQALTEYDFDEANRYSESVNADDYGTKSTFGYGSHNLSWKTHNIDDSGMSRSETLTQTIERDTMGRVVTVVDRGGHETDYEYDGFGRRTTVIVDLPSSKERKTITTLEDDGSPEKIEVKVVDGMTTTTHAITKYYYDEANRQYQTTREDPDNSLTDRVTQVERDEIGRVAIRTDELGEDWETQWDDAGRMSKTIDPIGNEMQYAYNATSRTTTVTAHEYNTDTASFTDYVTVTTRDASGRTTSVDSQGSASGSRKREFAYDEGGRRLSAKQDDGMSEWIITEWEYDDLGRQTQETVRIDGSTDAITTTYWTDGGLKERVSDANAINTRWTYNSFGQETSVWYDDDDTDDYDRAFDSHGRLSTITDPMGVVKTFNYDVAGRVDYIDYTYGGSGLSGPDRIDYTYDDMDRITSAKTQDYVSMSYSDLVTVTRSYNGFGEMDSETQHGGHTIAYTHFDNGAVKTITYPSGGPLVGVEYLLDDNGRIDSVKRKLSTDVEGISTSTWETTAEFEYAGGREYERTQALYDLVRKQTYTSFREPDELTYKEVSSGDLLTGLDCDWDDAGRMVVRERMHDESGGTEMGEAFRYDDMGRLITMWRDLESPHSFTSTDPTAATANFQDKVAYDIGKVYERDDVTITPEAGTPVETIPVSLNTLYQTTSHDSNTLTWDDNGQLTDHGTTKDFVWTGLGQLAEAQINGETDREYSYDAFGRRVSTTVGSQVNEFLYHGWHMIGEYDDNAGNWLWQEIPMRSGERMLEHIALDTNDLDSDTNTTEYRPYAVHEDFQSTVWGLSDTDGDILERYNYTDPYGVSDSEDASTSALGDYASAVFHRKRLHGGFVEKVTEFYDFRRRWLDPSTGGWLSRDPLGVIDSENLHQTFRGNPLNFTDPNGLMAISSEGDGGPCYEKGEDEKPFNTLGCPAAKEQSNICQELNDRINSEWTFAFAALFIGLCERWVYCSCDADCPKNEEGKKVKGATTTSRRYGTYITIYYSQNPEDAPGGSNRSSRFGRQTGNETSSAPCCPCTDNLRATLLHEGLHRACRVLNWPPINCGHKKWDQTYYDGLEADMESCLATGNQSSEECNRFNEHVRIMAGN